MDKEKKKDKLILIRQNISLKDLEEDIPSIAIVLEGKLKEALDVISALTNMSYEEIISRSLIDGIGKMLENLEGETTLN